MPFPQSGIGRRAYAGCAPAMGRRVGASPGNGDARQHGWRICIYVEMNSSPVDSPLLNKVDVNPNPADVENPVPVVVQNVVGQVMEEITVVLMLQAVPVMELEGIPVSALC